MSDGLLKPIDPDVNLDWREHIQNLLRQPDQTHIFADLMVIYPEDLHSRRGVRGGSSVRVYAFCHIPP